MNRLLTSVPSCPKYSDDVQSGAIGLNRWIPVVGTGMCLTAVVVMFTQVGTLELMLFLGMLVSAVLIEIVARTQGRGFTMRRGAH